MQCVEQFFWRVFFWNERILNFDSSLKKRVIRWKEKKEIEKLIINDFASYCRIFPADEWRRMINNDKARWKIIKNWRLCIVRCIRGESLNLELLMKSLSIEWVSWKGSRTDVSSLIIVPHLHMTISRLRSIGLIRSIVLIG